MLYTKPYGVGSGQASTWGQDELLLHQIPFVQPLLPGLELGRKEETLGRDWRPDAPGVGGPTYQEILTLLLST